MIFGADNKAIPDILSTIGSTPLIEINRIYAKLETTNPSGSIKDRMAWYIIKKAEEREELKPGQKIIEVTSGNTGIAFSMISAIKGYKFTAVMPESMSIERKKMMKEFGAELVLTPAEEDISGAVKKYREIMENNPNAFYPNQFENPDNISAQRESIGQEIIKQAGEKNIKNIDAFVAGIGTGGTLIGVAQALKRVYPKIKIIGVEPAESAVLSGKSPGIHKIRGIGEGFIPKIVQDNMQWIDEIIQINDEDAVTMRKKLAKEHGILVGISSGANYLAALKAKEKYNIVFTVFPDRGERYLSEED